jgi:uncharacterized protein (TIGR00245 family)
MSILLPQQRRSLSRIAPLAEIPSADHSSTTTRRAVVSANNRDPTIRGISRFRSYLETRGQKEKVCGVILLSIMAFSLACTRRVMPTSDPSNSSSLLAILGWRGLMEAAFLLVVTGGLGLSLVGVPGLAQSLLVAAARGTIQLYVISGFLLTNVLMTQTTSSWVVASWIAFIGILAAREAAARVQYTYPRMSIDLTVALMSSTILVLGFSSTFRVFGHLDPWFSPRTWIPVAGMLYGNALTTGGLTAASLTKELVSQQKQIELQLLRGASLTEAVRSVVQSTLTTALTPTINSLSVTGIVHIPGMMTGQILAGQPPYQAAAYQVLIFILIATMSCTTALLFLRLSMERLADHKSHRLCTHLLTPRSSKSAKAEEKHSSFPCCFETDFSFGMIKMIQRSFARPVNNDETLRFINDASSEQENSVVDLFLDRSQSSGSPVLSLQAMRVPRTSFQVTLDVCAGDRVGIQGASGVGKSILLRSIVGLEAIDNRVVLLAGQSASGFFAPVWRSRVSLVPQDRSGLTGTPREMFLKACQYESQKDRANVRVRDPLAIAKEWDLPESAFDQSWTTLSGGEAQRASLAIALALESEVLLLDESTSALDEKTAKKVESTLERTGIAILLVSHSQDQIRRFCTHALTLEGSTAGLNV